MFFLKKKRADLLGVVGGERKPSFRLLCEQVTAVVTCRGYHSGIKETGVSFTKQVADVCLQNRIQHFIYVPSHRCTCNLLS